MPVRLVLGMLGMAALLAAGCGGGGNFGSSGSPSPTGPTPSQAEWLDPHNSVRAGTFSGVTLSPAPSPPLPALGWSASAATIAQAWASGCIYQHNSGRSADGVQRGENIAATAPADRSDATPSNIVGMWAGEWTDYAYATNTCAAGAVCGHYTQLVWRGTSLVGCAQARCTTNSPFGASFPTWDFFVCDYEPPGNYVGEKPY